MVVPRRCSRRCDDSAGCYRAFALLLGDGERARREPPSGRGHDHCCEERSVQERLIVVASSSSSLGVRCVVLGSRSFGSRSFGPGRFSDSSASPFATPRTHGGATVPMSPRGRPRRGGDLPYLRVNVRRVGRRINVAPTVRTNDHQHQSSVWFQEPLCEVASTFRPNRSCARRRQRRKRPDAIPCTTIIVISPSRCYCRRCCFGRRG